MRAFVWVVCILTATATARSYADGDILLTMTGYGPVRIGMTVSDAAEKLHETPPDTSRLSSGCDYVEMAGALFMLNQFKIVRIEVSSPHVVTPSGIKLGDPISKIKKIFGDRLSDEQQFYSDSADDRTLVVVSKDGKTAMRFEASQSQGVTEIYSGYESAIHYVEGCS